MHYVQNAVKQNKILHYRSTESWIFIPLSCNGVNQGMSKIYFELNLTRGISSASSALMMLKVL